MKILQNERQLAEGHVDWAEKQGAQIE